MDVLIIVLSLKFIPSFFQRLKSRPEGAKRRVSTCVDTALCPCRRTLSRRLSGREFIRCWLLEALDVLSLDIPPVSKETYRELRYFAELRFLLSDEPETVEMENLIAKHTNEALDFLQHAARGETTNYAQQERRDKITPAAALANIGSKKSGLVFEALIVGFLTAIAVLLMRSPEQAKRGIGWGEGCLAIIVIALYFGIKRWRRKR